jgi:hypothetical protein
MANEFFFVIAQNILVCIQNFSNNVQKIWLLVWVT